MTKEDEIALLEKHCQDLREHFDSVQIFVTRFVDDGEDRGGTVSIEQGSGNWFTRIGKIQEWMLAHNERTRQETRDKMEDE